MDNPSVSTSSNPNVASDTGIQESGRQVSAQLWLVGCFLIAASSQAHDYIPTVIDGETVYEFGDFGKAPNQFPTEVGELNVISSTIVTRSKDKILINDSFAPSSNESSTNGEGLPRTIAQPVQPTQK